LYAFEGEDPGLSLLPLAARRALDHAGLKLSLAAWQALPVDTREAVVELGSFDVVDCARLGALLVHASPPPTALQASADPSAAAVPAMLSDALGPTRPLPASSWSAMSPLDRYALWKVASRGREERIAQAYDELVGHSALSSHLEAAGGVRMVNVGRKPETLRVAVAESFVSLNAEAMARIIARDAPKGDVLATARVAGIMAAKKTADWIPLCHPLNLTKVSIHLDLEPAASHLRIRAEVEVFDRTGVEMEALVAASAAALTVYDMLKSFDRGMQIGPTRLIAKSGGRSGDFQRIEGVDTGGGGVNP
jgi:cyclic pyranopterin phosphate synthase